ncbi:MAG: FAD-dependent oxidoreductase [Sphingobacteriales bacterium]|nr:FAD-dependent oxidoreductase [Sphingobacteriales bacterium]
MKKAVIIGSGFAGLSAAAFMAKAGWDVTVLEKHDTPGGRARQMLVDGFMFDRGPSWYWMPDVFERFFNCFGKKVSDYYALDRLDPSYRVYWPDAAMDIPADYAALKDIFEKTETGAAAKLDLFMKEAAYKYAVGMFKLVHKPGQSLTEFLDVDLIKGVFKLDVFTSMKQHIAKYFTHPKLQQLLEFPVLFLGALAQDTPALYSLMNYADIKLGTWYPKGGMYKIVEGMFAVGLNKKIEGLQHHSLFFDTSFDVHGKEIYKDPQWPSDPLVYLGAPSVSDKTVAPPGCENLFFLIPVATGLLGDTELIRDQYFEKILSRFESKTGQSVRDAIIYKKSYSVSDFINDYHSFKGNAYGLANTLSQTAVLKPGIRSKKVKNLFYTGQLTVPGPGVPPSLISGELVSKQVVKYFNN